MKQELSGDTQRDCNWQAKIACRYIFNMFEAPIVSICKLKVTPDARHRIALSSIRFVPKNRREDKATTEDVRSKSRPGKGD